MEKKRLLFVDDEPMVLKGLQQTLRKMRHESEIQYAEGGQRHTGIVIGDVTGHGISSALLMTTARAFIRERITAPYSTAAIMTDVHRHLACDVDGTNRFMSMFYCEIDGNRRSIS